MKINEFEKLINYKFKNVELIELAFTHSSLKKRIKKNISYERLEFLGDRVLSLIISHELFIKFPNEDEGSLSKRLSDLVSKNKLIEVAKELNLQGLLKIDSSERKNMNKNKNNSILSDVCESVIGAIFLDGGVSEARKFIKKYWKDKIDENILPPTDPKTLLQEIIQKKGAKLPKYTLKSKKGPSHYPEFEVTVSVEGFKTFTGIGKTIKIAQINAAKKHLDFIKN
jgi:ribonuclease-3